MVCVLGWPRSDVTKTGGSVWDVLLKWQMFYIRVSSAKHARMEKNQKEAKTPNNDSQ